MSQAPNKPTLPAIAEGDEPLPQPTNWVLAELAGVKVGSIGESWANTNLSVEWAEALKFVQNESKIKVENKAGMKNHVGSFAKSLRKLYLFVVVKGKIQVLYG